MCWAPRQRRGGRSSPLLCVAQGLPAEPNLDGVELILKLLNPGFSGSASPRLVLPLWLPQFPCMQRQELQALGWSQGCCLTPTLNTCEVTPPCVRVHCRADLWDQAQLAPAQSLWPFQFLGRERTPSLRATTSLPFSPLSLKHIFGALPSTSSSTVCFLLFPQPRGRHPVPSSELGSAFP